jgi:hypothetical protein
MASSITRHRNDTELVADRVGDFGFGRNPSG